MAAVPAGGEMHDELSLNNDLLISALWYAENGWAVFPCAPGAKEPLIPASAGGRGFLDATTDEAQIRRWWEATPRANIGVATGLSGLVVVDVDTKNQGDATYDGLRAECGALIFDTVTALTPSGGSHLVYAIDGTVVKSGAHVLGPGIDIRADGGYVVVAPSVVNGKPYHWEVGYSPRDRQPAIWPDALDSKIMRKAFAAPLDESRSIPDGERNAVMTSLAGSMRRRGFDFDEIVGALQVTNHKRCVPALPSADVDRIAQSVCRYEPRHDAFSANGAAQGANGAIEPLATIDTLELLAGEDTPPKFAVEPLFPTPGLVLLSGDTGSCKTSLLLSASYAFALSLPVANRFPTFPEGRGVLYVNGEMNRSFLRRFVAANIAGLGLARDDKRLAAVSFQGKNGLAEVLLGNPEAFETLRAHIARTRPGLVVLDTLRSLFDLDEKETQVVRRVLRELTALAVEFNTCIILAHHQRKLSAVSNALRERVSGSRDLIAAVDVHLALRAPSGKPMTALLLDKTRQPIGGIGPGTEWPIATHWLDGEPPTSSFVAGEPAATTDDSAREDAKLEIIELLATGPKTRKELNATKGTHRRALDDDLIPSGEVVVVGKAGQAHLLGLSGSSAALLEVLE